MTVTPTTTNAIQDFDFLVGRWHVRHRRLADYFATDAPWQEFEGTMENRPVLGGAGNIDMYSAPSFPGHGDWRGLALRLFEPSTGRWRIWWASTAGDGQLDIPVVGRFVNGHGLFESDDVVYGRAVKVHYEWLDITASSAHWQQSFSTDGGRSYRANWIMELTRAGRRRRA